jgi:hypothetical protein
VKAVSNTLARGDVRPRCSPSQEMALSFGRQPVTIRPIFPAPDHGDDDMKSTLAVLIVTAFATSVFAIERITSTDCPAAPAAACAACEKECDCGKPCCEQAEAAADSSSSVAAAQVVSTTTIAACGDECKCCSQCACAQQNGTTDAASATAAKWTAASTEFAAIIVDEAAAANCCSGKSQCTASCEADCSGICTSACCATAKQANCGSYRIQPTDILTIFVPALAPKTAEVEQVLAAKNITCDQPASEGDFVVQPNGCIAIGAGEVKVDGLTTDEARLAIMKKIFETKPEASRAAFAVFVEVSAKNSQQAYVVLQADGRHDIVWQVPTSDEATVRSVIEKTAWPHPIDFASARIWISRRGAEGQETLLPVTWDAANSKPICESNHAVLPGDRVFVKLSAEPPLPVPPPPVAAAEFPALPHPITYYAPALAVAPRPHDQMVYNPPAVPPLLREMRYSAIPAAAPSPFVTQPSILHAFPMTIAPQPLTASQQQPPMPQTAATQNVDCAKADCDCKQVEFAITIVEDTSGSFSEFPKLRDGAMMISDSDSTLGAVRIMEKQKLVKRISEPQIRCAVGEQTTFCLTSVPSTGKESNGTESLSIQVKAQATNSSGNQAQMTVETGFQAARGRQIRQLQIAFQIEEGQTAILKTSHEPRPSTNADADGAVYFVVTPKVVK